MSGTQVNEVVFDGALEPAGRRIGVVALATDLTIERDLRLIQEIQKAHPQAPVTTSLAALSAALQVKRLSFFTPYTAEINRSLAAQQTAAGLEVVNIDGLGLDDDTEVAGIAAAGFGRLLAGIC